MGELVTAAKARIQMAWGHADPGTRGGDWYTAGDGQARRHSCVREEVGHCASGPLPCKQRTANPGLRFWVYPVEGNYKHMGGHIQRLNHHL